jgi:hypothetical protein
MSFSNLISKLQQTWVRVLWALKLGDYPFRRHAIDPRQNHQVNLIKSDQTQTSDDAAQVQLETAKTEAMECWLIGPNYTWCHSGRVRN